VTHDAGDQKPLERGSQEPSEVLVVERFKAVTKVARARRQQEEKSSTGGLLLLGAF
jgi:hypothetical protein